ncbi:lipid II:glycine glycyltransferase FemX [Brachybacterium aquaticum]|uniref:Lipid II:glycine glycyltransferase (Peptidoglycan interpeptide bridge formation enzyme) n=1 Tax=Brachybacterium aquaticum TaxID=1432564 RepID=A0A841AD06_9MICO|nr:peptidoglycan bridge formation glycyltransferase FemA/FemB family protein [Brachybacterium aquaticum]MBB5832726.1 lipid II:glycine glycyltransferase (peptidoglycan interpeptide bridge formation enzyme) [Brachybacterium aquaticum]
MNDGTCSGDGAVLTEPPDGDDPPVGTGAGSLEVRSISEDEFAEHVRAAEEVSYQQTAEWAEARGGAWEHELVGWFDAVGRRVGASVIRYQALPVIRYRIAYIPFGPVMDWGQVPIGGVLGSLRRYLEGRRVFAIRMYPPLHHRTWRSSTVHRALADSSLQHLAHVRPDAIDPVAVRVVSVLREQGWRPLDDDEALESTQPRFTFRIPLAGRTEEDVFAGLTKAWRKNIRSAARQGLEVEPASRDELREVHRLHVETAERSGFAAHPLSIMEFLWDRSNSAGPFALDVDLGRHEGEVLSGIITASVGRVAYALIAGNSAHRRELRASNAVYWAQIRRSIGRGATAYDLGGVRPSLDADDPRVGLLQFKIGLGGEVNEGIGGWDLPLRPALYSAFMRLYPLHSSAITALGNRVRRSRAGGSA